MAGPMNNDLVLMIGKVKLRNMLGSIRHNRRAIEAEYGADSRIDAARSQLNVTLAGLDTPEAVHDDAKRRMEAAGYERPRKDAVAFIEAVFSLRSDTNVNVVEYFKACTAWAERHFGCPVATSDIHLDEAAPHCHVLILPLLDGLLNGSKLLGYGKAFNAHLDSFYAEVANGFGMHRSTKLKGRAKATTVDAVIEALHQHQRLVADELWPLIRQQIQREPEPWALAMGINAATLPKRRRSFTAIMISTGKGPQRERKDHHDHADSPIGFVSADGSLSCVAFQPSSTPVLGHYNRQDTVPSDAETPIIEPSMQAVDAGPSQGAVYTRIRDDPHDAGRWDSDRGEFFVMPPSGTRPPRTGPRSSP